MRRHEPRPPLGVTIDPFGADALGDSRVRVIRGDSVTIHGTIKGTHSIIDEVTCNNSRASLQWKRFQCTVAVNERIGTGILVRAKDRTGNTGYAETSVMSDNTPPSVTITSPKAGAVVHGPSVLVTGYAGDNFPFGVSLQVNGVDVPIRDAAFSANIPLGAEATSITAVVRDAVGNTATASVMIARR